MIDPNKPIEYRYLNVDTGILFTDATEFYESTFPGYTIKCIPSTTHEQVLIAACSRDFTHYEAIIMCRNLTFNNLQNVGQ